MRRALGRFFLFALLLLSHSVGHAHTPLVVEFNDAPLHKVMEIFGIVANRDILYMKGVNLRTRITIRLEGVSFDQALTEVLAAVDLGWIERGHYIYVGPKFPREPPPN